MASLTLRGDDLAAIDGAFEFDDHERITMADAGQDSGTTAHKETPAATPEKNRVPQTTEHAVSAADELHVFAALDEIGADVGEPVSVETDSTRQHVVVSAMGLPAAREQDIREALASIPNAVVRFSSAQAPSSTSQSAAGSNGNLGDNNPTLRRSLERSAGGAAQLQAITDRALDASNLLLARAHALTVLAQKFSPDIEASLSEASRELLSRLRRKHATVIEQTTSTLETALRPLLPMPATNLDQYRETGVPPNASWQTGAAELFDRVHALDQSVTNLLGANYSDAEAQETMDRLPKNLQDVEALAHQQARTE
jgi:hypothetical protein